MTRILSFVLFIFLLTSVLVYGAVLDENNLPNVGLFDDSDPFLILDCGQNGETQVPTTQCQGELNEGYTINGTLVVGIGTDPIGECTVSGAQVSCPAVPVAKSLGETELQIGLKNGFSTKTKIIFDVVNRLSEVESEPLIETITTNLDEELSNFTNAQNTGDPDNQIQTSSTNTTTNSTTNGEEADSLDIAILDNSIFESNSNTNTNITSSIINTIRGNLPRTGGFTWLVIALVIVCFSILLVPISRLIKKKEPKNIDIVNNKN